jgi:hypothetical protein
MSEELTVLNEYYMSLGLNQKEITLDDLANLKEELLEAGEYGLARLVGSFSSPQDLLDYVGEEQ